MFHATFQAILMANGEDPLERRHCEKMLQAHHLCMGGGRSHEFLSTYFFLRVSVPEPSPHVQVSPKEDTGMSLSSLGSVSGLGRSHREEPHSRRSCETESHCLHGRIYLSKCAVGSSCSLKYCPVGW